MTIRNKRYESIENNERVNRWYLNVRARSAISADIWRRTLGMYCRINGLTPDDILVKARDGSLRDNFQDFVISMISQGKKGAYLAKVKQVLHNWLSFNDVDYRIKINIPNENINESTMDETVPTKDELARILRMATTRGRVSIVLMALSGLRPESIGDYEGGDGLRISDLEDLDLVSLTFSKIPAKVNIKNNLSKARFRYFTFLSAESSKYVIEYLTERKNDGEQLKPESPLLGPDPGNTSTYHDFLRTQLVSREIRKAIRGAGLQMRPYVLRAYFATGLDIAESKGLISHPWRMFMMGHKGDIESTYSTNKRLLPQTIEEMRNAFLKCTPYLETESHGVPEDDLTKIKNDVRKEYIALFYPDATDQELDELLQLEPQELQKRIRERMGMVMNNGHRQKVISQREVKHYIEDLGWEYIKDLGKSEAIVRLPES